MCLGFAIIYFFVFYVVVVIIMNNSPAIWAMALMISSNTVNQKGKGKI